MIKAFKCCVIFLFLGTYMLAVLGQFKKLGSHKPPSKGATVLAGQFPDPGVFYYHFIQLGQPLLMKNVLNETRYPAFEKWSDDYLRTMYGDERVDIERGKKEDRDGRSLELKLSKFLDIYKDSNLYMVHTVPDGMKDEVLVPTSLQCGGFQDNLQEAVLWFSSGDTKSVLHYDTVDNINCLLDGEKKLVLIDKSYKEKVEEHGWVEDGAYSEVNVDSVDPGMYPGIYNAAWYQINMQKGDCVYIPYKWYHHVYSPPGRNLAVNLWFSHLWWFNQTDCSNYKDIENKPFSQFTIASPNMQLRSDFLSAFEGSKGVSQKYFVMKCGCKNEEDALKLWEMLNTDGDRQLTWEEFYSFDVDEAVQKVPQCFNVEIDGDDDDDNDDKGEEFVKGDNQEVIDNNDENGKGENQDVIDKGDNNDEDGKGDNKDEVKVDDILDNTLEPNVYEETNKVEENEDPDNKELNIDDVSDSLPTEEGKEVVESEESAETVSSATDKDLNSIDDKDIDGDSDTANSWEYKNKVKHDEF